MITRFDCLNFRNVSCSNLEFERVNILIGANNAGKSNFIRALSFAANMVSNTVTETTAFFSELKRNGWNSVANRRVTDFTFQLAWTFDLKKGQPVSYTLHAHTGDFREDNYITKESLDAAEARNGSKIPYNFFECHTPRLGIGHGEFSSAGMTSAKNNRVRANVDKYESVLLQMDKLFFTNKKMFSTPFVRDEIRNVLETMREYFRSFYSYSCTFFNLAAIREMQDDQNDGSYLKKDASNFANVFATAEKKDPYFNDKYYRMLHRMMGDCENIHVRRANGKLWIELHVAGVDFPLSEVSDGTIHLLLLLLLLSTPEINGISMLAIDEPEMNLHPAWQKLLAKEILRCQSFEQCFISTHSPDFLDEFTENFLSGDVGVFVFDPTSRISIRKLARDELAEELKNWTLGDLYRIGDPIIGGWPQ